MSKVRQGQDGLFFVESSSKRDTMEHAVTTDLVCTCTDYSTRCAPRRRASPKVVLWPAPDRNTCRHAAQVVQYVGLMVLENLRKQD